MSCIFILSDRKDRGTKCGGSNATSTIVLSRQILSVGCLLLRKSYDVTAAGFGIYNLALTWPSGLTNALPFVNTVFPPSTLTMNLISSNPSLSTSPVLHISVISLSAGLTGAAKRAWNSFRFSGLLLPNAWRIACADMFQENKPWIIGPPKPIFLPGSGSAWRGL